MKFTKRSNIKTADKLKLKEIKPVSLKKINIICIVGLVISTALLFLLLVSPSAKRTNKLEVKLDRSNMELEAKERFARELRTLIKQYSQDLKLAKEYIFTDKDIATFLENFSDFAKQANMTLVSIKRSAVRKAPVSEQSEKTLQELREGKNSKKGRDKASSAGDKKDEMPGLLMQPMKVTVIGEYRDLINFLVSLEEYKQLLTINDISIDVSRLGYPLLRASFTIYLYTMQLPDDGNMGEV